MDHYNRLIIQIREAIEMKDTVDPIDYTTDLFSEDVIENDMEDWGRILNELDNHINSAIREVNNILDSRLIFKQKSELSLTKTEVNNVSVDEFDPFYEPSFPYDFKTPDNRYFQINNMEEEKLIHSQISIFEKIKWLNLQKERIAKCKVYMSEHEDEKPFRKGNGLPTIPFHGNQANFIALINLLIYGGFIPIRGRDSKEDLKRLELPASVLGDYETFYGLPAKQIAFLFADYFHSVVINEKLNQSGKTEKKIEKTSFSHKTIQSKLSGSNISDMDIQKLLHLENQFKKMLDRIKVYKNEKALGSQDN